MRGCLLVVVALCGCRGFFDVAPVSPDATAQPDGPSVPVGYVQSAANTVTAGTSVTVSFPLAQQMGNSNLLVIGWGGGSIISINDSHHNTYGAATGQIQGGDGWTQQIYLANAIDVGTDSVNVTFSAATYIHLGIFEYTGIAGVDTSAGMVGTASESPQSGALTTTNAHDLLFAALTSQNMVNTTLINSYTTRLSSAEYVMGDQQVTSAGGYLATTNASTQADWVMQLLALEAQ